MDELNIKLKPLFQTTVRLGLSKLMFLVLEYVAKGQTKFSDISGLNKILFHFFLTIK